jgi:hypothetical protein
MEAKLKTQPQTTITMVLDKAIFAPFSPLLQKGFFVEAPTGCTIKTLLCDHFNIDENYLENRVKTIFLDGKPVDDLDRATVSNGSVLALSAAMPGLVGSTLRRGGVLAGFRSSITYQQVDATSHSPRGVQILIKLFNLVVNELGPAFLNDGIIVRREDMERIFSDRSAELETFVRSLELDAKEMPYGQLASADWSEMTEQLLFKISSISGVDDQSTELLKSA